MELDFVGRILVLLFLLFHKLRIKQTARFGNPFGLQTSLVFYGLVLQRTLSFSVNYETCCKTMLSIV